ncbi:hypothetical protein IAT38_000801 [Cryptococcus sp. DSM 104549]
MPKASKGGKGGKGKVYSLPAAQKKRGLDVPKFQAKVKAAGSQARPTTASLAALSSAAAESTTTSDISGVSFYEPIDSSLTRDSSSKAFMRELRKVIERSDVIIQVLDARDPEGTRSKWVEEEVRKRDMQGKKLLAVVNKIDLVPRANLEAWLKHLRHSFPTMPFKSSTQTQRHNLSQNAVPIAQTATVPGQQAAALPALPTTSSSLGAPALLHLLKQYALSTPHSALTVGVVGYPNVGKSSLINSLKRSRSCAVADMPGKTRVVQEVVLDKGVKILDCPGVVLQDIGRSEEGAEGRRRQAEIMLRNCVKAEIVEDPISPVEVILTKVDPAQLQKLYNIPPYDDVRDFLIKIALTRGRLGKGGIPDLEGSAVSILRDWNSGKIAYFTVPPKFHASSMPGPTPAGPPGQTVVEGAGDVAMEGEKVGDAKILATLSEAFTLDGLFDNFNDGAAWEGEEAPAEDVMLEDPDVLVPEPALAPAPAPVHARPTAASNKRGFMSDSDDMDSDNESDDFRPTVLPLSNTLNFPGPSLLPRAPLHHPSAQPTRLFTQEELAVLPSNLLDRNKLKSQAKKAKKRRAAAERTEGELMAGFIDMDMDEPEAMVEELPSVPEQRSKKEKRKEKKAAESNARREQRREEAEAQEMEMDEDAKKEKEFANFLANMGADDSDEEL